MRQRDGSLAAGLLRLPGVRTAVSDDKEQPDSDGLDALASGLPANEADEPDEDLDLASLAAVVGARTTSAGEHEAPAPGPEKLQLAGVAPAPSLSPKAPAAVAPAMQAAAPPPPAAGRSALVPVLMVLALGIGVGGYLLGRSARPADGGEAAGEQAPMAAAPSAAPREQTRPEPPRVAAPQPPPPSAATPATGAPPALAGARPRVAATEQARPIEPAKPPPIAAAPPPAAVAEPAEPVAAPPAQKPSEAPAAALAKTEPASRSMDQLLDDALTGSSELPPPGGRRAADSPAPATLPEAPSREEVTQAMAVLLPAIRGCAMGQTGLATAGIVVRRDGRVASVELTGAPFEGTASGRCMEGVLRRARFSRFRQPTFRVRFPFAIQ